MRDDDGYPAKTRTRNQRAAAAAAAQPLYVLHSPRIRASVSVALLPHALLLEFRKHSLRILLLLLMLRCHVQERGRRRIGVVHRAVNRGAS